MQSCFNKLLSQSGKIFLTMSKFQQPYIPKTDIFSNIKKKIFPHSKKYYKQSEKTI